MWIVHISGQEWHCRTPSNVLYVIDTFAENRLDFTVEYVIE